jgi:hypothetical protein
VLRDGGVRRKRVAVNRIGDTMRRAPAKSPGIGRTIEMREDDRDADRLDEMVEELLAQSAKLAALVAETAAMLVAVLEERAKSAEADGERSVRSRAAVPIPADVLEITAVQAQSAGMRVDDYVRDALLAYAALCDPDLDAADTDLHARVAQAVRRAYEMRADNRAVKAENHQAVARGTNVRTETARARKGSGERREARQRARGPS